MDWSKEETMKNVHAAVLAGLCLAAAPSAAQRNKLLEIPDVPRDRVICFALYTVHKGVMKMTAQLYPLQENEGRTVRLEVKRDSRWVEVAQSPVIERGWTAHFRVEDWDPTKDAPYRLTHAQGTEYTGIVRADPVDKDVIVVAAFTGNSIYPGHGGDIPKTDIVENLRKVEPDLLFFSGDQVYDHFHHYEYWLRFGRDFGDIIRSTPTVTIPDDHDVGQANLWGQSGRVSHTRAGHDGGYAAPVEYVKEVERAQTSHLPDPYDPTPVERGIGVYYTDLTVGRISFAIVEDRKFKTGPQGLVPQMGPRPDHVATPDYDPRALDIPEARLLGCRQLEFLDRWAADWHDCDMKAVLSQTIFAGGAHLHGRRDNRLYVDLDSNGWPQTGRNKALMAMRKAFALHIAGDQHLGTIIHHGVNDWNDSCYSFCVPSIANLYLRWWAPLEAGQNREPWMPEHLGEFEDGLGNKVTMLAVANPSPEENHDKLTTRAAGFGLVRFNKRTREITLECWPRNVDVTDRRSTCYPGWPRTIHQFDNYGREATQYLPTLRVTGMTDPVVQVVDEESGEIVYTVRINGREFRPKVFKRATYTVKVGEPGTNRFTVIPGVHSLGPDESGELRIAPKRR
jgi:hypothetical protein